MARILFIPFTNTVQFTNTYLPTELWSALTKVNFSSRLTVKDAYAEGVHAEEMLGRNLKK